MANVAHLYNRRVAYGNDLRWYSFVANGNAEHLEWIIANPAAMIGFSDAGAHLRDMAFYNFPLRMLKRVRDAQRAGRPFMSVEDAVRKLTSDIAEFHRIDAGRLVAGARADVVVIDEEPMPEFTGLNRLVRRNDDTVRAVLVNGRVAWRGGSPADDLGASRDYGQVLPLGGA